MANPTSMDFSHQVPHNATILDSNGYTQPMSSIKYVGTACTLKVFEQCVHVTAAVTVTLPPVSEAVGRVFVISAEAAGTIADQDDSYGWDTDVTLADKDVVILVSNGIAWARANAIDT